MTHAALIMLFLAPGQADDLLIKPYVVLGDGGSLNVMWHVKPNDANWELHFEDRKVGNGPDRMVQVGGMDNHVVKHATLAGLRPGQELTYRLNRNGELVFSSSVVAPKSSDQEYTFAAYGDIGRGTPAQRRVAYQVYRKRPDFQVLLGDLAYPHGRMSEYRKFLFPIQNHDKASPETGAPLLRQIPSAPVWGNHDSAYRDLAKYPDGLGIYSYWVTPQNGPKMPQTIKGTASAVAALDRASGNTLSTSGNYSFNYGNAHWVVIDANHYANIRRAEFRKWLDQELANGSTSTWRFVALHAPPYSSSNRHSGDTYTRAVTDLFTKHKVDVVFAGHIHNYQRTHPMRAQGDKWELDRTFDGKSVTRPNGTIYMIGGTGGAEPYDPKQPSQPETWKPFTARFLGGHGFSHVAVKGRELTLRHINDRGDVIDQIRVTK
jgi:acid phosphatase type 7